MAKVTFKNGDKAFFNDLKCGVDQYFNENKIKKTGNFSLFLKTMTLVPIAVVLYIILLTVSLPVLAGVALSGLFGFVLAGIGFNIMHDACHGSYSSRKWVNDTLGLYSECIGRQCFHLEIQT